MQVRFGIRCGGVVFVVQVGVGDGVGFGWRSKCLVFDTSEALSQIGQAFSSTPTQNLKDFTLWDGRLGMFMAESTSLSYFYLLEFTWLPKLVIPLSL